MVKAIEAPAAGSKWGRLTILGEGASRNGSRMCLVRCDCGTEKSVDMCHIRKGNINSCGCLRRETTSATRKTHGLSCKAPYRVWASMKDRCSRKQDRGYKNYGGRGIAVCEEWKNSFEAFWRDMGPTYKRGLMIERVDNDLGYSAANCTWATREAQIENRRVTRWVIVDGVRMSCARAERTLGLTKQRIRSNAVQCCRTDQEAVDYIIRTEGLTSPRSRCRSKRR